MKSLKEVVELLRPWCERNERQAWLPVVIDGDGSRTDSKFSGTPWLAASEEWPTCGTCRQRMPLFVQLDLEKTPAAAHQAYGKGLLQLFYCTTCHDGWEPFSKASLVRIVDPSQQTAIADGIQRPDDLQVRTITGWNPVTDSPHPEDHEALGLHMDYAFKATPQFVHVQCDDPAINVQCHEVDDLADTVSNAKPGDKLGGWPYWIQSSEYPACPQCGAQMDLLLQLDSEVNLDFMFGDSGVGHITQCPAHKDVVAFGWACC